MLCFDVINFAFHAISQIISVFLELCSIEVIELKKLEYKTEQNLQYVGHWITDYLMAELKIFK